MYLHAQVFPFMVSGPYNLIWIKIWYTCTKKKKVKTLSLKTKQNTEMRLNYTSNDTIRQEHASEK